jgi:putative transposase
MDERLKFIARLLDGEKMAPLAREFSISRKAAIVTTCGRIGFNTRKINLSQVFAGQMVGIKQVDEHIWLVSFMHYDLGYSTMRPADWSPSPTPSARKCYLCLRNNP